MNILEALQAQSGETGETFIDVNSNGPTAVPGGDDLLLSEFARLGTDLQITLPSGDEVVVVDYFAGDGAPPELVTEGGAVMNGGLVTQLAGPMIPDTQVAQSGTSDAQGEPAGSIDTMTGIVTATRGGVEVELNAGDPIYEGDVLNTADGSAVGIIFADDSTMSMGANARISIDEMVYDADAGQGSQLFDIVQGAFVFASGQIGHNNPEDVQVRTPVATIGIRGTKYAVDVDQVLGDATVTLFEGAVVVQNSGGQVLLNSIGQSTRIGSAFDAPSDVFVMPADEQTETYGDAIDYHPNKPQLREDDDGGGQDGSGGENDLSAEELEALAEQLDDLDTAAGPSGAIAGFTQSALFLRLLNGVLEGNDLLSGELANENGIFGSSPLLLDDFNKVINDPLNLGGDDDSPFDQSFGPGAFGSGGGTVTFTFGSGSNISVTGGSSSQDIFSIDVTGHSLGTTWTVGQNSSGNVIIQESGGTNINMDEVEELSIDLGDSADSITIGDLSNSDIAESTVSISGGDGDDVINAALAGKRLVAEGGDGDDQIIGGTSNDNLFGDAGDDTLAGGTGNDLLVGGDGDDTILVQANGTGINEFPGYQDEVDRLNDLIADLDAETDSEEIAALQQKVEDLSRDVDIVQGGDGNDTLTLSFSPGLLGETGVVADLIALKEFVDNGGEGPQTFEALGIQVSSIETLNFVNLPAPVASASLNIGAAVEDGSVDVALTLSGSESGELFSTTVTISGVPEGATLIAADGTEFLGGADIELSGDAIGNFQIALAADSDEDFQLSVSVEVENVLDGGTATGSVVGTVAVDGIADAPIVSVTNASGDEDSQISLSIDVGQGDADGSEELTVSIDGLPIGAILSDANGNLLDPADVPVDALQGLQLLAPLNFSGALNLTVTATSTEDGTSATTSQSFTVDVAGVADAVEMTVEDVVGGEDSVIPLSIDVDLTDADETLTISIDGLPDGATLLDADGNPVDASNVPVEALSGLALSVADNFSGDISLTVTATNADGESTNLSGQGFTVSITPVADDPVLTLGDGSGNEDGSIDLNLDASLADTDGSESLTVVITGVPAGAVLKDANGDEVDPSNVPVDALGGLSLLPPQNFSGDITLSVTATSTDGESTAVQTGNLTISVTGVADAPDLTVSNAAGEEGVPLSLNISSALTDTDGSETLSISISGLPLGAALQDADGNTVDPANVPTSALNGLVLLPALGTVGSFALTVTATATEADGDTNSVTETLGLTLGEVAAAPILSVLDAVGDEDGSIALTISAEPGQEGDTVTVTIGNLPAGATLTNDAGDTFQGGADVTLTPDQLAGLTVHPAPNSDADLNLTVTATANDGEATSEVSSGLSVTVDAVADVPTLTVSDATGVEGVPLSLNISSGLTDTDGSETLSIEISGLPDGAVLKDGDGNTVDPSNVPTSALNGLMLVPALGTIGTFSLTVTATATESDGGDTAVISETIGLNLSEAVVAPILSVVDASGDEDGSIALTISAEPGQAGDTVTVTIGNLPAGATLTNDAGDTFQGGADITLTPEQLAGLTVHPVPNSDAAINLTVTATAVDGQEVETTSANLTVTVDAVADVPTLTVSDVSGAFGLAGVDELTGTDGDDTLTGGAGGDTLLGGDGNDTLIGDGDLLPATVALDITSSLQDIDGSESLSVTISGIPDGVQLLQDGVELVTGGSFELTGGLTGLTLIVPPGTEDFELTVTATATENANEDAASIESTIAVTLDDGSDLDLDDVLDGGAGNDVILGGAGDDTITSGTGQDTIEGGDGNDVISVIQESAGGDIIDGGAGNDTLTLTVTDWDLLDIGIVTDVLALVEFVTSGAAATGSKVFNSLGIEVKNIEAVNILDINGNPIDPGALEGITFTGGDGDDVTSGSQFDDTMSGGDGDDTLSGLGGDDTLTGGDDDDVLDGGDGNDTLSGGDDDDVLIGGAGDDKLSGGDDDDTLDGGDGTDTLIGGDGDDTLDGGDGGDTVWGGDGDDVIEGGAGDDTLDGGDGDDTIYGGAGDDTITGGKGDDVIHVDGGNDVVDAGDGDDLTVVTIDSSETDRDVTLNGGDGDDTLRISLDEDHPGLDGVIAEIAAATIAAQQNPGSEQTIESLGITFSDFEDIEIFVGDAQVSFGPDIADQGDVSTDTAAIQSGIPVLTDLDVQDIDGDVLMQATVEITGGFAEGDRLSVDEDLLSDLGITLETADAGDDGFLLVLSGDASIEDYEAALATVRFSSDSDAPDAGTRTLSVTVTDDDGNEADPIDVSVNVGVGEEANLADTSGTDQDSVAFISETDEVGTTVDSITDLGQSSTETLSVTVGKNGNGNTGEFEVIVNGQSMGVYTTTVKATGRNGEFETIEIGEVSLPHGEAASIEVRAIEQNSGVLLQAIQYGDVVIDAESGDTSTLAGLFDEVVDGVNDGQSFSDIWSGLTDNLANLFSNSYVFLDPDGDSSSYSLTPGDGGSSTADWQQTDGDTTTTPDVSDLGERYDGIDMGDGTDWAVASAGTENDLNVDLSDDAWEGTENVLGGKGDDTLKGNEDANLLAGGDGNDVLIADGGNDLLVGGAGDDEGHFDISDLKQAGGNDDGENFGTLDQAISDAYAANDADGAEALRNIRAGFDGGSGTDTLKLSGGSADGTDLSSDDIVDAVSNIEILDVTGVEGPVDMSLSVDDLIEMTDENDELKIMKEGDDKVNIGGQEYGVGEHTFSIDGVDLKVVIEETPPESG